VKLQHINVIGLQPVQRFIELFRGALRRPTIDLRHQERLVAIAVAQRSAHTLFALAAGVIPTIVQEVYTAVNPGTYDTDRKLGIGGLTQMKAADSNDRYLFAGATK
jgi:hypothetical protein